MMSISARGSAAGVADYLDENQAKRGQEEDYYQRDGHGEWWGEGAEQLGLAGKVVREDFIHLGEGRSLDGRNLVQGAGETHRTGWDLTFSAPKSVSIAWGLAGADLKREIEAAHQQAVRRALEILQQEAAFTRRGNGGQRQERAGLVGALYQHGTSRQGDMQLHTHAFVFNVGARADGTWGTLESRHFYTWQKAAGAGYRAEMAHEMQQLGFVVERDAQAFRLTAVPASLEKEFSQRRAQIEAALAERRASSAEASEVAALDTRQAKTTHIDQSELRDQWQERAWALEAGWTPEAGRADPVKLALSEDEKILTDLTQQESVFTRAKLAAAVLQDAQGSQTVEDALLRIDGLLRSEQVVALASGRYTTVEMKQIENAMGQAALQMHHAGSHEVDLAHLETAIASRTLSGEQMLALAHVAAPGQIKSVQGVAGAGKSYMLGAAREAWESQGFNVWGAALSGKAAEGLESGSGIRSFTLHALERGLEEQPLTSNDVLVVDEAGMVGTRQMARVVDHCQRAGAKLVLVGDTDQMQAIEAGAAFRLLQAITGFASLDDIRRQRDDVDKKIVRDLRAGRAQEALQALENLGRVHAGRNLEDARAGMGRAIATDLHSGVTSVGITATRTDAKLVNQSARAAARQQGLLTGPDVEMQTSHGLRSFAAGDRLLVTRNADPEKRSGTGVTGGRIKNGDFGRVLKIDGARLIVELDRGGLRDIDVGQFDHVDHGYAATGHKLQGATLDRAHVLGTGEGFESREWSYVAGSRHRGELHVHSSEADLSDLPDTWSASRQKSNVRDFDPFTKAADAAHRAADTARMAKLSAVYSNLMTALAQCRDPKMIIKILVEHAKNLVRAHEEVGAIQYKSFGDSMTKLQEMSAESADESHGDGGASAAEKAASTADAEPQADAGAGELREQSHEMELGE